MGNTPAIDQNIESIRHTHGDIAYQAESLAEAMRLCPVLGSLALEDAQLLIDAVAFGQQEPTDQDVHKPESKPIQFITTETKAAEIIDKPAVKQKDIFGYSSMNNWPLPKEHILEDQVTQSLPSTIAEFKSPDETDLAEKPHADSIHPIKEPLVSAHEPRDHSEVLKTPLVEEPQDTVDIQLGTFESPKTTSYVPAAATTPLTDTKDEIGHTQQHAYEAVYMDNQEPIYTSVVMQAEEESLSTNSSSTLSELDFNSAHTSSETTDPVSEMLVIEPQEPTEMFLDILRSVEGIYDETEPAKQNILVPVIESIEEVSEENEIILEPLLTHISHLAEEIVTMQGNVHEKEHISELIQDLEDTLTQVLEVLGLRAEDELIQVIGAQIITRYKQVNNTKTSDLNSGDFTRNYMRETKAGLSSYRSGATNERDLLSLLIGIFTVFASTQNPA